MQGILFTELGRNLSKQSNIYKKIKNKNKYIPFFAKGSTPTTLQPSSEECNMYPRCGHWNCNTLEFVSSSSII
jgi:hypothetical protein